MSTLFSLKNICCLLLSAVVISRAGAQSYSGTGGAIPDNGVSSVTFSIPVSGLSQAALTSAHGLTSVCLNINHTYDSDLQIILVSPDGTEVTLVNSAGGGGHNFTNTCFSQSATNYVMFGSAPFSGTYRPALNMGYVNNGQNGNGTWQLRIFDQYTQDNGSLVSWAITFGANAPVAAPFTSSNLPIMFINTHNQGISDPVKLTADMGIVYNGPGAVNHVTDARNNYNAKIGIELHGSSSQQFPKKNFGLETRDISGNDSNASLIGMPAQSDWELYASYTDKSLLNNVLAYQMFRNFGSYAPRTRYVELMINNQYQGVYVLTETIKRDSARVNISKLKTTDTAGDEVTGGYIIKIDKTTGGGGAGWTSAVLPPVHPSGQTIFYQYDYPNDSAIVPKQKDYIHKFVDSFEHALNALPLYDTVTGWRKYADETSFIRYFLLNEVSRNVDGYRISTYLYKAKSTKGNKLYAGPPWDYDIAFHNANYCNGDQDTGWAYQFGVYNCSTDGSQVPFWWGRMMQDTVYANHLKCAYTTLRSTALDTTQLFHYIDSTALVLDSAERRNFAAWQILGSYVWPNPSPIPSTYAGEITELKQYLIRRLRWLDAHMPGVCRPATPIGTGISAPAALACRVYPNPFTEELNLEIISPANDELSLRLCSMDGRVAIVKNVGVSAGRNSLPVFDHQQSLPAGWYFLQVNGSNGVSTFKVLRQ